MDNKRHFKFSQKQKIGGINMNRVLDVKNMKRIVLLEDTGLYLKKGMKGYLRHEDRDEDTAYLDYDNRLVGSGFVLNTFVDGNEYVPYCAERLRYEIIVEEL